MSIPFTRWPEEFARRYRENLLQDLPLTDILTRHAASDSIAVIDGERQLSYRELNQVAIASRVVYAVRALNLVKNPRRADWVMLRICILPF